ncbi:MAG: tetratricopeptide repeat protein [Rhodocyclaceae bacterium]|nr:MAG: tetratricopeptide repeat protein [Rhodocyclaceae bacterium]
MRKNRGRTPSPRHNRPPAAPADRTDTPGASGGSDTPTVGRDGRRWLAFGLAIVATVSLAGWWLSRQTTPTTAGADPSPRAASYVGGTACAACHSEQHAALRGSHHDRAMAVADESSVLGDFANARLTHAGVTTTFFRRDGKYFVTTDGPDGKLAEFEIPYTFGFTPLQQYLVRFPDGRLQALGVAWDARPPKDGGGRWFHLYPQRPLKAGDPLHWTGIEQVWNYQCADCHSTNLRKNYDPKTNTYATTWTDLNVSCEACHGPGSNHLAWAKKEGDWRRFAGPGKGLTVALDERRDASWTIDGQSGNAARSSPRQSAREIEVCARCHARRGQFSDQWLAGDAFADGFRASLLEPGLYEDDGQMRDEVYNYASFLSSRMHAAGVTCSDCHDPHSLKLRAPGSAVCAPCHAPARFAVPAHHHHAAGSPGADCMACHLPVTTYMVVDPRHDHSFRIPRPDRSVRLGVPNACNACHRDQTAEWAAAAVRKWYPHPNPGFQTFAEAFANARRQGPGAAQELAAIVDDRAQSAIARASAVHRLAPYLGPQVLPALRTALADDDPLLRAAAANVLSAADVDTRLRLLPARLGDPRREVRMAAAQALAGDAETRLSASDRRRFEQALGEYVAAEKFDADRPEGRTNLGNLAAVRGRYDEAIAAYKDALALDPSFVPAAVNLADVYRRLGQETHAEGTLRAAIERDARAASAHFALGLSLTRQQRRPEALDALTQAATLAPENPHYAYVLAVALADAGEPQRALATLVTALRRHPNDRDLLLTQAQTLSGVGQPERALPALHHLARLEPDDRRIADLLAEVERAARASGRRLPERPRSGRD